MIIVAVLALAGSDPIVTAPAEPPAPPWRATPDFHYIPPVPTWRDYPADALQADVEGTSLVRLEIDGDGRIQSCRPIRSAGIPSLDEAACTLYRTRARFRLLPHAVAPVIATAPVRWVLEDGPPPGEPSATAAMPKR